MKKKIDRTNINYKYCSIYTYKELYTIPKKIWELVNLIVSEKFGIKSLLSITLIIEAGGTRI